MVGQNPESNDQQVNVDCVEILASGGSIALPGGLPRRGENGKSAWST